MNMLISYPISAFADTAAALEFIYPHLAIDITAIMAPRAYPDGYDNFDPAGSAQRLRELRAPSFSITDEPDAWHREKNRITFRTDEKRSVHLLSVMIENEENIRWQMLIEASATLGFTFAYKFDFQKARWQSEELVHNYESERRPHAHLKKIIDPRMPPFLQNKVDISENPGHQRLTYTMQLMAAPEMWFGPGCWKYFTRQRLMDFPDADAILPMEGDVVYVRLFDWTTPDYEAGKILNLQERFRKWVGMDEVETRLQDMLA